jgi:hypothetical protein
MAISVQLDLNEIAELRQQSLTLAKEMSIWLKSNPGAPDYFARAEMLRELIAQLDHWERQGIEIAVDSNMAGGAVDQINAATKSLQKATARVASIGAKVEVFGAFVDLMVAISAGKPEDIVKKGIALADAADNL